VQASIGINGTDIRELSFWIRNLNNDHLGIRLIDASGRCHQFSLKAENTPEWQKVVLPLERFFEKQGTAEAVTSVLRYEAWGGGKGGDGKWKGPAKSLVVMVGKTEKEKIRTLWISGVTAIPPLKKDAVGAKQSFQADFEAGSLPEGWTKVGNVSRDGNGFGSKGSLLLQKSEETLRDDISASSPSFAVQPGRWDIQFAGKSDLKSQDNSYSGSLEIEVQDGTGKTLLKRELLSLFRQNDWKQQRIPVEFPAGAASARFVARINKETPGKFWIDGLAVTAQAGKGDDRVKRIMFSTQRLGHLLFPDDPRVFSLEVWSSQPLDEDQLSMTCVVKDYWSAEQGAPVKVQLKEAGRKDSFFRYEGSLDLADQPLEIGRYYEIHANIVRSGGDPFTNYSSFAILPEAPANQFKPEEVPFTSRNWDNRFEEYVRLTNRLGIRICGVWGRMDADPSKVEAPQIELIKSLGMGFLTGSPAHAVEQRSKGWEELMANDGQKMREGVRNFIAKYGAIRPMIVNLGNEPHAKGDAVKTDVEAYRIIYDEIKKVDPGIYVVGTSIGLDEENYFKFGFGKYCDAYDVHTYESPESVKHNLTVRYPEMFRKYGEIKPIWSTEIGLNSQGLTRQIVASTLFKKFAYFFAGGGANVSWFGLLYPDPDGTQAASSGSAHNVFDCRYNKFAPKLDAVAYYNAVNAISTKKFIQEKTYGQDLHVFLFRDKENRALLICFKDQGRREVSLPLGNVGAVKAIRIDGSLHSFEPEEGKISLTMSEDPILLLYEGGDQNLPEKLPDAAYSLGDSVARIDQGKTSSFDVVLGGVSPDRLNLQAPPLWKTGKAAVKNGEGKDVLRFTVEPPPETSAREADMTVYVNNADGKAAGALFFRPSVGGTVSLGLAAEPGTEKGNPIRLKIRNHGSNRQEVTWELVLKGEQSESGAMTRTKAYFSEPPSGVVLIGKNEESEVVVPLAGLEDGKSYRVEAVVRDGSGRLTTEFKDVTRKGVAPLSK